MYEVRVLGQAESPVRLDPQQRPVADGGSAGKPTGGDPRACWALVETSPAKVSVSFRRVEYDIDKVAQAIVNSNLPDEFAAQVREARGYLPEVTSGRAT